MIQLINKLKKNQKGFTLVELIVVLVILAILAAFTIPAMLGFVQDARDKAEIASAREVYVAAQGAASEMTAQNKKVEWNANTSTPYVAAVIKYINGDITITPIATVADGSEGSVQKGQVSVTVGDDGKVSKVVYGGQNANIKITGSASGNSADIIERTTATP